MVIVVGPEENRMKIEAIIDAVNNSKGIKGKKGIHEFLESKVIKK